MEVLYSHGWFVYNLHTRHKLLITLCDNIEPSHTDCARFVAKKAEVRLQTILHLAVDYMLRVVYTKFNDI